MENTGGLRGLENLVLKQDGCTMCGACLGLCPYLQEWRGRIVKLHDCDLQEGRCYLHCPRTKVDLPALYDARFPDREIPVEMGVVRALFMARAVDSELRSRGQSGAVVSALVGVALEEGMVQAAILTQRGQDLLPMGRRVTTREEVLECAGSSYVASPTVVALNRGPWNGTERIAFVGVPCQVMATAKMRTCGLGQPGPAARVVLTIGLFCTWALSYDPFIGFLRERLHGQEIRGMDISPPPERMLRVRTIGGEVEIPVDEIRPFIRSACSVCPDMTSELADLSVGTVEGEPGWNTVVVRTEVASSLLEKAREKGVLETRPLPKANEDHLLEASLMKKRRALVRLRDRGELEGGYLVLGPGWESLLSQQGVES
ncbi:MAG: Coenzyme F420 hydrogenase/dehydrogenase, beta subunit C-terminal domain [Thermodesulfobacteriota bacterium]